MLDIIKRPIIGAARAAGTPGAGTLTSSASRRRSSGEITLGPVQTRTFTPSKR